MANNDKEQKELDPKYLKGLTFRASKSEVVKEEGEKVRKFTVTKRAMRVEDVLSWKDYGKHVVIVTADGQKVMVRK